MIGLQQGSSISGPRAKSGPRRPNNWPAEQRQNAEDIYYMFSKNPFFCINNSAYIFIFVINEILILVEFSLVMQDEL